MLVDVINRTVSINVRIGFAGIRLVGGAVFIRRGDPLGDIAAQVI